MRSKQPRNPSTFTGGNAATLLTLRDHVRELQGRVLIVSLAFIAVGALAVPFFDAIVNILMAPLSPEQKLVYLTPGGAFNFILKVCIYVGIIGALPVIIFHLYRFLMPAVRRLHMRTALRYTLISLGLAVVGILFAYFVSLPAALYFLTNFDLYHIDPMLTIDSYLSFVMTYIAASAALFQLPLVMSIIDSIKPLTPKKMMGYQRHIIIGSFVVAAIVTPTPDALNQAILAAPMIVMYQVGVMIITLRHRRRVTAAPTHAPRTVEVDVPASLVAAADIAARPSPVAPSTRMITDVRAPVRPAINVRRENATRMDRTLVATREAARLVAPRRSIDGIILPERA